MVVYTFILSTQETEADLCEFKARLVYILSFRLNRATYIHSEILPQKTKKIYINVCI